VEKMRRGKFGDALRLEQTGETYLGLGTPFDGVWRLAVAPATCCPAGKALGPVGVKAGEPAPANQ